MTTYLLDTNISIYALKRRPPQVLDRLRVVGPSAVAISVITLLELRQGAEGSVRSAATHRVLDLFLASMPALDFDADAALHSARVRAHLRRAGTPIGDLDSLIAGHALAVSRVLVTNNEREFTRVPGLTIENWATSD